MFDTGAKLYAKLSPTFSLGAFDGVQYLSVLALPKPETLNFI